MFKIEILIKYWLFFDGMTMIRLAVDIDETLAQTNLLWAQHHIEAYENPEGLSAEDINDLLPRPKGRGIKPPGSLRSPLKIINIGFIIKKLNI